MPAFLDFITATSISEWSQDVAFIYGLSRWQVHFVFGLVSVSFSYLATQLKHNRRCVHYYTPLNLTLISAV